MVDFAAELGAVAADMRKLAEEGVMLLKGVVEGESVTKYFLSFRNAIIRSGKIEEIKDAIAKIFREGKDDLGRYLESAVKGVLDEGVLGGKILTAEEIAAWAKKVFDEFGTKLEKVGTFKNPKVFGQFDPNTNTIRYKEGVTEYIMAHEYYHALEMKRIGFPEYVKDCPFDGVPEELWTHSNWINLYLREKFVFENLMKNSEKHLLNAAERFEATRYINEIAFDAKELGIRLPD